MATPRTVAFYTLGCKLNYSETSAIGRTFEERGYTQVKFEEGANIYVINTCSVTDFADKKCRQIVRRALRFSPDAFVVVMGCYAQLKPEEIANIPGVDLVLGAAEKFRVLDFIDELGHSSEKGMIRASDVKEANQFTNSFSFGDRTRSFLKVQDGCDYKCSFCTIPLARGASRSDTVQNVIDNAHKIAELGAKEIVLTGINLGDFGNGTEVIEGVKPKKSDLFIDLIRALDEQVKGIERFRISSIEPNLCTDEVIEFVATSERFVPHFHIPLQSGNDKQLKAMRRRYNCELYASRIAKIKLLMPHCCIGVDVMVGFPDETDDDFLETYRFLESLDVSYFHVFTYSERPNTLAAEMENVVPMEKRRKRNEMLRALSEKKKQDFYKQYLGRYRDVLFEVHRDENLMTGFTNNYIKIEAPFQAEMINKIGTVQLMSIKENGNIEAMLAEVPEAIFDY